MDAESMKILGQRCWQNLKVLSLESNGITDEALKKLCEVPMQSL